MAVKWGILSTADINKKLLAGAAASDDVDVVAVGSRDLGRAEEFARAWGIDRAYGTYDELLADPDVEAVYIPLPNTMHSEWSIRALEAGKHVLCEKPFSRHIDEVERAFDAADATGRHLAEAFMYRHHPQTARLAELVASGVIGELRVIRSAFSYSLYDAENIRLRVDVEGGSLMDVGCYCVSGSRLLGGEPESVVGAAHVGPSGTDWVFTGLMRFPERCRCALRLRHVAPEPGRTGGNRDGGVALSRRSVALPEPGDRAEEGRAGRSHRSRGRQPVHARARGPECGHSWRAAAAPRPGRRPWAGQGDRGAPSLGRRESRRRDVTHGKPPGGYPRKERHNHLREDEESNESNCPRSERSSLRLPLRCRRWLRRRRSGHRRPRLHEHDEDEADGSGARSGSRWPIWSRQARQLPPHGAGSECDGRASAAPARRPSR